MKALKKMIVSLLVVAIVGAGFAGCAVDPKGPRKTPAGKEYDLGISVYQGEYGKQWIDALATKYEAETLAAGKPVRIHVTEAKGDSVTRALEDKSKDVDLFFTQKVEWQIQSRKNGGNLEKLDDLLEREVEDGVKLKDRVDANLLKSSRYVDGYYKLPWTNGVGGLVYNKKMFDANKWEIPTVYTNPSNPTCKATVGAVGLVELCALIYNNGKGVTPFAWSAESYYWDYVVFDWWMQLFGAEKLAEYVKCGDPELFNPATSPELATALKAWNDLVGSKKEYSIKNASGTEYNAAQIAFVGGGAAMMPNAQWLQRGMSAVIDPAKCELAVMPTPKMTGAKPGNVSFSVGSGDSILISKHAPGKELAKDFVVWMAKKENIEIFTAETQGAILAMDYTGIESREDATVFEKSVMNIHKNSTKYNLLSDSPIAIGAFVNMEWPGMASQPYKSVFDSNGAVDIDKLFTDAHTKLKNEWQSYKDNVGM